MRRRAGIVGVICAAVVVGLVPASARAAGGAGLGAAASKADTAAGSSPLRLADPQAVKHPKSPAASGAVSRPGGVPAGEEIVTATSDTGGYHLFAAAVGDGWRWHALATLQPGGYGEEAWIGEHCITGDGRYVVAVVAPWSANNSAAGIAAGGIAYAVDAHTGAVRPLASGLMLSYFNPGCGTGSSVALSRYASVDQSATQILTVDAATGKSATTPVLDNQVTSAIPVGGSVYAAEGHRLVRVGADGAVTVVSTHGGPVFDLIPDSVGGVDYLAQDTTRGADPATSVYRLAGGKVARVADGDLRTLRLLPGSGGRDTVLGAASAVRAAIRQPVAVPRVEVDSSVDASDEGSMAVEPGTSPGTVDLLAIDGSARGGGTLPPPAPPTKLLPPVPGLRSTTTAGPHTAAPLDVPNGGGDAGALCAVPRNDPAYQVPQPSDAQIDWALNEAAQGALPSRTDAFDNLHTGAYNPSADFPLPAPFGANTPIPQQVLQGIFAQESNWKQASPHAPAGLSGNPLIADYYGIYSQSNGSGYIDFPLADCGYGLGQVTDMMRQALPGTPPSALQARVAVDYAENAAATAQILAIKWNQLAHSGPGITVGSDNPKEIEDWYFAIWAYNSGVNPQASTGNTSGCTPGPSCADADGNWGLGWTNNPANPTYSPTRHAFLHDTHDVLTRADAASPQNWPYQEKVFGWIESGQLEGDGVTLKYNPTYNYATASGFFLSLPRVNDFCDTSDHCTLSATPQPCGYGAVGDPLRWHCWWHESAPATYCAGTCHPGSWDYASGDAEPPASNPFPSVCNPPDTFVTGTLLVDDSAAETNLAGCTGMAAANAPMQWLPNTDPNGNPFGDIDLHQLGTGYGGRSMFTHLQDTSNALWGGTMVWAPAGIVGGETYDIEVFVPTLGAAGTLTYTIHNDGNPIASVQVNQNNYGNQWVSLGTYQLNPGAEVTTTNVVAGGDGSTDVSFDAIAFRPSPVWTRADARTDLLNRLAGPAQIFAPKLKDDENPPQTMDTLKVLQTSNAHYIAVYTANWTVKLATSGDLVHWHYVTDLVDGASQPYLAQEQNGSYLLADEALDLPPQQGGPSHVVFHHYADLGSLMIAKDDLLQGGGIARTLSLCNEGTPDIHGISADGRTVYYGFHYGSTCAAQPGLSDPLDREGFGTVTGLGTVNEIVNTTADTVRDNVVTALSPGYPLKHGERDDIVWHGWRFSLEEAQLGSTDDKNYDNWRFVLYDYTDDTAYPVGLTSNLTPVCHGNPRITLMTDPAGNPILVVTAYVFSECTSSAPADSGPLLYTVPAG